MSTRSIAIRIPLAICMRNSYKSASPGSLERLIIYKIKQLKATFESRKEAMRVLHSQNERLACRRARRIRSQRDELLLRRELCASRFRRTPSRAAKFFFVSSFSIQFPPRIESVVTAKHSGILKVNQWGKKSQNTGFIFQGDSVFFLPFLVSA